MKYQDKRIGGLAYITVVWQRIHLRNEIRKLGPE